MRHARAGSLISEIKSGKPERLKVRGVAVAGKRFFINATGKTRQVIQQEILASVENAIFVDNLEDLETDDAGSKTNEDLGRKGGNDPGNGRNADGI